VSYPFDRWPALDPGCELTFPVAVTVPADAAPGTRAVAFVVTQRVTNAGIGTDVEPQTQVRLDLDLGSQAIIRVSGDAQSAAQLAQITSPRVLWGGDPGRFRVRVANTGDTDLELDSQIVLSPFVGVAGRTLQGDAQTALPEGVREFTLRWSDPPLFGWFEPKLTVVGGKGSGVRLTKTLPTVYVLPPWWLLALVVVAIALPLWARRRRRRRPEWDEQRRSRARTRVEERLRAADAKQRAARARGRRP